MAVSANIPGVGRVDVDGAASESTLQALVAAVAKANNLTYRSIKDTENDLKNQAAAASVAAKSMNNMSQAAGGAAAATQSAYSKIVDNFSSSKNIFDESSADLTNFGQNLRITAAEISKSWSRAFSDTATDPIARASDTFSRAINLAGQGAGLLGNNISKVIPGKLGLGTQAFVKGAVALGQEGFQMVNSILATEMQATVKTMSTFNEMGATFGGGMMEMRTMALDSGLSLQQFGAVIRENRNEVLGLGGTLADGSLKVSRTMEQLSTQTGTSGRSLREELLNMGISLEEQGKIAISYMANQRALTSTTAMRGASEKDIAMKTRQYAEDLKILSEQTGKDAKAIADKARQESMRSAVLGKLTKTEQDGLQASLRGMETVPDSIRDNFKTALLQQLAGGTITDPLVAGNEEYMKYVKEAAARIRQGGDNVQNEQLKSTARLAQTIKKQAEIGDTVGNFADTARLYNSNVDAFTAKQADASNAFILASTNLTEEGIDKSKAAMGEAANTTEKLQTSMTQMQIAASDFNKNLGHIASNLLPTYAGIVKSTNEAMTSLMTTMQRLATGNLNLDTFLKDLKNGILRTLKENFGTQAPAGAASGRAAERRANRAPLPEVDMEVRQGGPTTVTNPDQANQAPPPTREPGRAVERREIGGPVMADMPYLIGEAGPELFVPDAAGQILTMKTMQERFSALKSMQSSQQDTSKANETDSTQSTKEILTSFIEGSNGVASIMNAMKNQIADDNKQQLSMLQEQIAKLDDLVSTMKDNVRASENIVNVLA